MSRKYRHRGYQDEDRPRVRRQAPPLSERREGPRGRGLGAPTATVFRCARCGARQELGRRVTPAATCGGCGEELHTCTNCRFLDPDAPNQCRVDVPVRIARKSSGNDCDLFEPKETKEGASETSEPKDARSEFDALFDL